MDAGEALTPDAALRAGIALFDGGEYWEAHEAWEERWLEADGDESSALGALIQLAAALDHATRTGRVRAACYLLDEARAKLASLQGERPLGLDVAALDTGIARLRADLHARADEARPDEAGAFRLAALFGPTPSP